MSSEDNNLILVVDDSQDDYKFISRAFKKTNCTNPIKHLLNGDEAIDYLFYNNQFKSPSQNPRPGLILLDLNMPGTDGLTVLQKIKSDPELKKIPIVILTTSDDPKDINSCYQAGANSYLVKPATFNGFIKSMESLKGFWFEISFLPSEGEN